MNRIFFLNIGNTHTQVATIVDDGLQILAVYDTNILDKHIPLLDECQEWQGYAVCVVPTLKSNLQKRYGDTLHFLSCGDFKQLDFSSVDTSTLGLDRISNAFAAYSLTKGPVIVVDCGTCINTVVVDGAGHFLGGAISPGRGIMRRALNSYTAQLPLIDTWDEVPPPIGRNTREAMAAGADLACIGALRELITRTLAQLDNGYSVYATGGDSTYFIKALPGMLSPAPPLLTLTGVKLVWDSLGRPGL